MKRIWILWASFFGVGYTPIAPGTAGSLVTVLIIYFLKPYWQAPLYVQLVVIFIIFLTGIPAAYYAEKHFKKEDPRHCVIDEVAGQMVTLLLVPHSIGLYIAGFFIFRFFDIIKPFPVKHTEKVPYGVGIMIDDIAAGLYSLGLLHLLIYIF